MNFIQILFSTNTRLFSTTTHYRNHREIRVRFAPSPTGDLHLGGLRTAFYNYIFAKQNRGKFILRIEDTDQTRIVPGSAEDFEDILNWAGLKPDESPILGGEYGPYIQSERLDLYRKRSNELIDLGRAYRCFCSSTRLELLRKHQSKNREKPRYDGKCKYLSPAEIKEKLNETGGYHIIRFALRPGQTIFDDLIFGKISNDLVEGLESDPVILKSDQYPTYHFANVVDDHAMKISHVLRGSEWISSTTKHVQLYQAFNWATPKFAHFPLITMKDGSKMSKRNNQSHVRSWMKAGYRPLALLNFLTNMGGGMPKDKQDSMDLWDLETIIENFNFSKVTCHSGSADIERLNIYNSKDLQITWKENPKMILDQLKILLKEKHITNELEDNFLTTIVEQLIHRVITLDELLYKGMFIWQYPTLTWSLREYYDKGWDLKEIVDSIITIVIDTNFEDKFILMSKLTEIARKYNIDRPSFMKFIRKLLTNCESGLPVHEIFLCLGKSRLLNYLDRGLKYVS